MLRKMCALDAAYGFYQNEEKTLVGFSGGADSVALLHALLELRGKRNVVAFHLNHMLRGEESERDEIFCRRFCEERDIVFLSQKHDIRAIAGNTALEETARNIRYEALEKAANAKGCTTISLAHHAGDNLETMIFHLCRGTGLSGLSGIPPKRPLGRLQIVRPLLDCTKEEILAYLAAHGLSYVTDSTNADTDYTRNFIRHEILPNLRKINPQAEENARKTAEIAADAAFFLKKEAHRALLPYSDAKAPRGFLMSLEPSLLYAVLSELYVRAGGETLSAIQNAALTDLVFSKKSGRSVSLTGQITARLDGENLRFFRENEDNFVPFSQKIALKPGKNRLPNGIFVYLGTPFDEKIHKKITFRAFVLLPEEYVSSLYFRARENGEAYRFGGMTRKFKKLLCGANRTAKRRPLLCDENGILWHPSFPLADRASEGTIELHYIETEEL